MFDQLENKEIVVVDKEDDNDDDIDDEEDEVCTSPHPISQMANFATKHSIMTQEMVDSFCNSFYIPAEVHPTALGRGKTIFEFLAGTLEKDPAPHLTTRQEQAVKLLESHKALFRRYPECFLCLVGLSPYNPFDENSYPAFEYPDGTEMGLFDFIKTVDPWKVQAVEVQRGANQMKLLESIEHYFMPLVPRAPGGSSSAADAEVSAPVEERLEDVAANDAYLELVDPGEDTVVARRGEKEVVTEQPKKIKKKRLIKQRDVLPAKKLRTDHPSLASGTGGKTLAGFEQIGQQHSFVGLRNSLLHPSLEESKGLMILFYQHCYHDPCQAKHWAARQICLGSEVRSRAENELELKEKLNAKYAAREVFFDCGCFRSQCHHYSTQKDHDISLLDSRANHLESALNDAQVACTEAETKIASLASERNRLVSEVSFLHAGFKDFKEKMEVQQEEQAQELYNHVAELEAHVIDVFGRLEGEFYPHLLDSFGRKEEGLEAGHEHGVAGRSLSMVDAYNQEVARASYVNAVKTLEDASFPLVDLLKSKKDAGMDEVLDCFMLDEPLAGLSRKSASFTP
ncbi:hypothetical protein Tco_0001373 [Tanacetum coccineum]